MYPRTLAPKVREALRDTPVVAISGPRQSGSPWENGYCESVNGKLCCIKGRRKLTSTLDQKKRAGDAHTNHSVETFRVRGDDLRHACRHDPGLLAQKCGAVGCCKGLFHRSGSLTTGCGWKSDLSGITPRSRQSVFRFPHMPTTALPLLMRASYGVCILGVLVFVMRPQGSRRSAARPKQGR